MKLSNEQLYYYLGLALDELSTQSEKLNNSFVYREISCDEYAKRELQINQEVAKIKELRNSLKI